MTAVPLAGESSVLAPAKINLALQVCGKRADGYHLLDSLVVFAGHGDWLSFKPSRTLSLTVTGPFADDLDVAHDDNLILRAARFLATATGVQAGAAIQLEKNLPIASGIGGGSSDAAASLLGCAGLWSENLAQLADADIARALGADTPVCLRRRTSFMSGVGEVIEPAPSLPPAWLVLANPRRALITKDVFAAPGQGRSGPLPRSRFEGLETCAALAKVLKDCANDLYAPARALLPEIVAVVEALERTGRCHLARMSGSGPTCFGLYEDSAAAGMAAATISAKHPGWWVQAAPVIQ